MDRIEEDTRKFVEKRKKEREMNKVLRQKVRRHKAEMFNPTSRRLGSSNIITIPTVVHVVYNTAVENISDQQVQSQIDVLNEDFRRTNFDADNTWSQAADTEIQFCLAAITRTPTTVNSFGTNDAIKFSSQGGKDAWPASEYMNFWIGNVGGDFLGYARKYKNSSFWLPTRLP